MLVGRDPGEGRGGARALSRRSSPAAQVTLLYADLARLASVRRSPRSILAAAPRIDVLINNAGAIFRRRSETADGLERTFALNHMAYFTLTCLLATRLIASAPARIVNVASAAHRGARLDFDDLQIAPRL